MLPWFDSLRDMTFLSVTLRMLLAVICGGVIGIERDDRVEMNPSADATFDPGCRIWVVGESQGISVLLEDNISAPEVPAEA